MSAKDTKGHVMVRPCFEQDLQQVHLIYAHHVMTGTGTFETQPPDIKEMSRRWGRVVEAGWPYLVASPVSDLTRVLGFAYAQQFRDREAYKHTFEDSIYVAPGQERRGVGASLLATLLFGLEADGARQVIAVIGDLGNRASIQLHAKQGFAAAGRLTNVGYKFGRWLDVVIMQKTLAPPA